jgi:hypothetical protein
VLRPTFACAHCCLMHVSAAFCLVLVPMSGCVRPRTLRACCCCLVLVPGCSSTCSGSERSTGAWDGGHEAHGMCCCCLPPREIAADSRRDNRGSGLILAEENHCRFRLGIWFEEIRCRFPPRRIEGAGWFLQWTFARARIRAGLVGLPRLHLSRWWTVGLSLKIMNNDVLYIHTAVILWAVYM